MDTTTELALRAIVRGLFHADAINAVQVHGVMSALKDAAGAAMDRRDPASAKALVALCKGISADTAVGVGAPA